MVDLYTPTSPFLDVKFFPVRLIDFYQEGKPLTTTSVITKREVPQDLKSIPGLSTGFNPVPLERSRIVISGQPGSGKSTFLNSFPGAVVLDPERGGDTVSDPKAIRFTAPEGTPEDQLDLAYLKFADRIIDRKRAGATDVTMIGIDSYDQLIEVFLAALCARNNEPNPLKVDVGRGNGYTQVRMDIFGMLDRASQAGLGWAIVAHTAVETLTVGGNEIHKRVMAVTPSFRPPLFRKSEHMLMIEHALQTATPPPKQVTLPGGGVKRIPQKPVHKRVRRIKTLPGAEFTGGAEAADIKSRLPLPEHIVVPAVGGYEVFKAEFDLAISRLTRGTE